MADQPTRQDLYDRIRRTSKDEVVLEEMIRLGFWPARGEVPQDPADEIRARGDLQRQLDALRTEQSRLHNVEKLQKELRRRRFEAARLKRQETRERRLKEREARAHAWREQQKQVITYLGPDVSGGLNAVESDASRLEALGLPLLHTPLALATAMGISLGKLRFLAFTRPASRTTHYRRFALPKKSGGSRMIAAPMPRLKAAQHWILAQVLEKLPTHEAAHGFKTGRSIMSNAVPHVRADVVVNLDLKDFFPTVHYARVKGLFRSFGYSESLATVFGLLCTEPEVETVVLDDTVWHVSLGERHLPQGAPTSPAITNLLCRRLDETLTQEAQRLGFVYTRYADDLSFSGKDAAAAQTGLLLKRVQRAVQDAGFQVHPDKTRVLRRGRRQEVTGIVVNDRPNIPRETLRRFRATLFQIEHDGPEGKQWGEGQNLLAAIQGFASYVYMVNPSRGQGFQEQVRRIVEKYGKNDGEASDLPVGEERFIPVERPLAGLSDATHKTGEGSAETTSTQASPVEPATAPASVPTPEPPPDGPAPKKWWKLFGG